MPSLMTIPRELRDQICTYVLLAQTNEPPALDQSFSQLIQSRSIYKKPALKSWNSLVFGAPSNEVSNSLTLLLVNHQLHAETLENINLIGASLSYSLDVIILDEILPLTTWTSVPFLTTRVQEVDVNFRISGRYDLAQEYDKGDELYAPFGYYKGFRIGNGAGPAMSWQIYSILERFLRCGPIREAPSKHEDRNVIAKDLRTNVETPPGIDPSRLGKPNSSSWSGRTNSEKDVLDPSWLARFIQDNLRMLLSGYDLEWFSCGMILFESLDHIILSRDGAVVQRFDVAEMLKHIEADPNIRCLTPKKLSDSREKAWQVRKERGLKVLTS